jgi:hypothetical protein
VSETLCHLGLPLGVQAHERLRRNLERHVAHASQLAQRLYAWPVSDAAVAAARARAALRAASGAAGVLPVPLLCDILRELVRDAPSLWLRAAELLHATAATLSDAALTERARSALTCTAAACASCAMAELEAVDALGDRVAAAVPAAADREWLATHAHELCDVLEKLAAGDSFETTPCAGVSSVRLSDTELVLECTAGTRVCVSAAHAARTSATLRHMLESSHRGGTDACRVPLPQYAAEDVQRALGCAGQQDSLQGDDDTAHALMRSARAVAAANFLDTGEYLRQLTGAFAERLTRFARSVLGNACSEPHAAQSQSQPAKRVAATPQF